MVFSDDVKAVFSRDGEGIGGAEISLYGRSFLVISGHKGLCSLTPEEVTVRIGKRDKVRVTGEGLFVRRASIAEIYIGGRIRTVDFVDPQEVTG